MRYSFAAALVSTMTLMCLPAAAGAQEAAPARTATADCAKLTSLALPDVRITAAAAIAPNERITVAHCKVSGVIGREIHFELLLPDQWNQRFVMGGGGGYVGRIDNQAIGSVNAGFATSGTDTGHQAEGTDASWALGDLERQVNFGHLAVHRTATVSKAIVRAYYETAPRYSYFVGCSNGGRQGLMEAQRYPDDFDGIVSGAPALNFTSIALAFVRNAQALFPNPASAPVAGAITPENLTLVAKKVMEACDAADAVTDGVVDDPRTCSFKVSSLPACAGDRRGPDCVTAAQRTAIAAVYAPVSVGGETVYPGQPVGGEAETSGWRAWIAGPFGPPPPAPGRPPLQWSFGTQFFKGFVFGDPNWDYTRYDFSAWARDTKQAATILNADNPDLSAFVARRGKLLLWHGWSDAALNALETIRYYDRVVARDASATSAVRLFLMPGVQHCAGGAGPDSVEWVEAITAWVERTQAPERLIATKRDKGATVRTRPLCAYPQRAVYSGQGSTDEAERFVCQAQ